MIIRDITKQIDDYFAFLRRSALAEVDLADALVSYAQDEFTETLIHGENGPEVYEAKYKVGDKYYRVMLRPEWNRYDKQFYYIDGFSHKLCEEFTPTPQELAMKEFTFEIYVPKMVTVQAACLGDAVEEAIRKNNPRAHFFGDSDGS